MRFSDILKQCFFNMWRRKVRTILAVLGVFIGVFSILATVSIGLAITYTLDNSIENIDGIRVIKVFGFENGNKGDGRMAMRGRGQNGEKMDDNLIMRIKQIPGVGEVTSAFTLSGAVQIKSKKTYSSLDAVDLKILPYMGLKVTPEEIAAAEKNGVFLKGSFITQQILGKQIEFDEKGHPTQPKLTPEEEEMYAHEMLVHSFDYSKIDNGRGNRRSRDSEAESDTPKLVFPETKFKIQKIFPKYDYDQTGYVSIKAGLQAFQEFARKNPANANKVKEFAYEYSEYKKNHSYTNLMVGVDKVDQVKLVLTKLKDMGLSVFNPINMFDEMRKVFMWVQLVLGGLGGISLLVATIGITNTTIMTIYERTKEIGIMKVIGANLKDIRNLFLFESGMIGFTGGLFGSVVALILSNLANFIMRDSGLFNFASATDETVQVVSYIPAWLVIAALVISTSVGLIAGYFPSRRAMKMSALESLRSE